MSEVEWVGERLLPEFVSVRIERFHHQRIKTVWGGRHLLHGASPTQDGLILFSNDYLCLSSEAELQTAQADAIRRTASQALMSPVFHDDSSATRLLETELAQYLNVEDSVLCQSGWAANTGLLQAIASERTPVYLDRNAHMSLWYGARAVGAPILPFHHNDADSLRQRIKANGPGIIAVDSVYSTSGNLCALRDIAEASTEGGCVLVVDESHSLGVFGDNGATVTQTLGLQKHVHFITVSLAKAFAGRAGLIGCQRGFKDYFMMASYPTCFSSSLLDHELVWIKAALKKLKELEPRRKHLHAISTSLRQGLELAGVPVEKGSQQIIALQSGTEGRTMLLRDGLEQKGIFGSVFCAPATPRHHALIRLSLHSGITEAQVSCLVQSCAEVFQARAVN